MKCTVTKRTKQQKTKTLTNKTTRIQPNQINNFLFNLIDRLQIKKLFISDTFKTLTYEIQEFLKEEVRDQEGMLLQRLKMMKEQMRWTQ